MSFVCTQFKCLAKLVRKLVENICLHIVIWFQVFTDRYDLGAMAIKGYSAFPKVYGLEPHPQIVLYHIQDTC